jgi:hypothetical protein
MKLTVTIGEKHIDCFTEKLDEDSITELINLLYLELCAEIEKSENYD